MQVDWLDYGATKRRLQSRLGGWRRRARATIFDVNGAISIEFAFIAPLLIVLLLGIIQFDYAFFIQINMNNASREAARELAVGSAVYSSDTSCASPTAGSAAAVACNFVTALAGTNFTVTTCDPDNPDTTYCPDDCDVTFRISVPRTAIALGDILGFFDTGIMVAQTTMRLEGCAVP